MFYSNCSPVIFHIPVFSFLSFLFGRFDVAAIIIHHHRHRQRSDRCSALLTRRRRFRPSPSRLLVTSNSRCRLSSSSRHHQFLLWRVTTPSAQLVLGPAVIAAAVRDSTIKENWYIFSHSWCEDVYSLVLGSDRIDRLSPAARQCLPPMTQVHSFSSSG
jgi:hypothetical protein